MADIAIFRINYKSDFILTLQSDAGWLTPFCIKFWTGAPSKAYYAYYDGMSYTHCTPVEGDPTKLLVQFDDHHLPIGDLKFQIGYHFTVADFPTSIEDEVINQASVIIEVDDTPAQVMLDFNGETAPEIQFALPAYANEAQRIANEQARIAAEEQRIANEQARISAEETRQANEQQRINAEAERVSDFASLKTESEAATAAANIAATLANEKAQLADDKAALAQAAATLANAKAQLAADNAALAQAAATLANEKAVLAQQKAEYAQEQGDAAKTEAETAHALNEEVREDEEARDHAEQTRQQQEAARQTAESQRVTDFNTQMQQQQTAYTNAEAARDTAFDEAETERDAKVDAKVADITNLQAQIGYFVCDTNADTAAKTIAATGYALTTGGNIRIKMTNANTADAVTLNINSTGAKALFYNGTQASSTNSWEAGEVVEVYYDGTKYQASNAQGSGGGDAENIEYDNSQSGLTADNVQGALDEINGKTFIVDDISSIQYTERCYVSVTGDLAYNLNWKASDFIDIDEVSAGDVFVWGGIAWEPNACLVFYNDEGVVMQGFSAIGETRTFTIANDAAAIGATKVRVSFLKNGTPSLTHNGEDVLNIIHYITRGIQDIADELDSLPNAILTEAKSHTLNNSEFVRGSNDASGNITASTKRCITQELYDVDKNTTIEVANNGQAHVMLTYDADGTYRGVTTGWVTADATYTFDAPHKVRFLVSWDGSTSREISPNQITAAFTFITPSKLVEIIDNEIDAKVGGVSISDNDSFCRYNKKIKVYNPYKDHPANQYKGQMHCHTNNSDGGLSPAAVVAKYVGYGYDFMTITDHNYITPNPSPNADIVWMGDSYEDTRNSAGYQHMNVWNCSEVINKVSIYQTTNTPQSLVDHYVKNGDSVLSYNHPEYPPVYASDSTLENLPNGISFVEIYNSTIQTYIGEVNSLPTMANFGDMVIYNDTRYINQSTTKNSPNWQETTAEANPDGNLDRGFRIMLDSGKKVFCDAVDDFHRGDNMENRGWQMVFANSRTRQSIWNGLLIGASYASTGVSLNNVSFIDGVFKLDIADGANAVTTFYGYNNEVLGTSNGSTAIYEVTGDEKYVRAMVEIDGKKAWTQPIWVISVEKQYEF